MTELTLRKDKTSPITRLEMDNNFTILSDRVTLDTEQVVPSKKIFNKFPIVPDVPLDDISDKLGNKNLLDPLDVFGDLVSNKNKPIISVKTFDADIKAPISPEGDMTMNAATKLYFDRMNNRPILSTEYPVNPDTNPLSDKWFVLSSDGTEILEIYQYINSKWNLPLKIVQYEGGSNHHIVKLEDGTVWVAGSNDSSQIGFNGFPLVTNGFPTFYKLASEYDNPNKIVCAGNISIIEKSDGVVEFRGGGGYASGVYLNSSSTILPFTFPKIIATNGNLALYQKSDGTVWAAGYDAFGFLGLGLHTSDIQTLTEIPFLNNAKKLIIGEEL
jgi:hypothetical protein